jgi:hypothetical protein
MNSLTKVTFSFSALITSLAFAWLVLSTTGLVHGRSPRVTLEHKGGLDMSGGLELGNETGIFMYGTTAAF